MANETVGELTTDRETAGKLNSFRQILGDIEKKQGELKDKLSFNDGGQNASSIIHQRIKNLTTMLINKAKEEGDKNIEVKRDVLNMMLGQAEQVQKDFLNERLRIEGETRSLLTQAESIRSLYNAAIAESDRKKRASELADEDRSIRQADVKAKKESAESKKKSKRSEAAKKAAETRRRNREMKKQRTASDNA